MSGLLFLRPRHTIETLLRKIESIGRSDPSRVALADGDTIVSYSDLTESTDRIASALLDRDLSEGAAIVYLGLSLSDRIKALLAAAKTGLPIAVLNARDPHSVNLELMDSLNAVLILTDGMDETISEARHGRSVLPLDNIQSPGTGFAFSDAPPGRTGYFSYSSGSTGSPKTVLISRAIWAKAAEISVRETGITGKDRCTLFGENWPENVFGALSTGARIELYDFSDRGVGPLPQWLAERQISYMYCFSAVFRALGEAKNFNLPHLKTVCVCGEPTRPDDLATFQRLCSPQAIFLNAYGSVECSFIGQFVHLHGDPIHQSNISIGKLFPEHQFCILDENGETVKPGEVGALEIRSPFLAEEYLNDPERTARVFSTDPNGMRVYKTGDLVRLDAKGFLYHEGRTDDQVKIRGFSVRLSDVEHSLLEHPALNKVACTAFVSPRGIKQLACHYVAVSSQVPLDKDLRAYFAERLPAYMVPSYFLAHTILPTTGSGKIQRRDLPNPLDHRTNSENSIKDHTLTGAEAVIAGFWGRILGHDDFHPDEEFADAGGTSLQTMSLLLELEARYDLMLQLDSLTLEGSSIRYLARVIEKLARKTPASGLKRLGGPANGKPLYFLPVAGGHFSDYLELLHELRHDWSMFGVLPKESAGPESPGVSIQDMGSDACDRILEDNPTGPHFVIGCSFGALPAYETARALARKGFPATRLILFDPHTPWLRKGPNWLRGGFKMRTVLGLLRKDGASAAWRQAQRIFLKNNFPSDMRAAHLAASYNYLPKRLSAPKPLIISSLENENRLSEQSAWKTLTSDADIWNCFGDHVGIIRAPNVQNLADSLVSWMNRV